ncbi:diketogulonate reductase-like aldo/keto reductase [Skermanella aerolata]|uniref:aldo/keto reductase n=1 Tax=Skermanella aerolata TaxID=393310 RepID=UPI003D1E4CCB
MTRHSVLSRRALLALMAAGSTAMLAPGLSRAQTGGPEPLPEPRPGLRRIPSTGEQVPAVGLGTWITFNVGADPTLRDESADVMDAFFKAGGQMIDSSPMYGSAQEVVGYGLRKLGHPQALFSADKVWISSPAAGPGQIEESRRFWDIPRFDLLQVHNLLSWESHLETLFAMKAEGKLRYVGITTSEGRRHGEFERIMASQPLDFVQVSYNALDREVERRILPLAQERGIGAIVNRPFRQGSLTRSLEGEALPDWAAEIGAATWAQFLLKFIVSHPAVTCAIPATTQVAHVTENMAASAGPMPDEEMRRRMAAFVEDI